MQALNDGTMTADDATASLGSPEDAVDDLDRVVLRREPDPLGFAANVEALKSGLTPKVLLTVFVGSEGFANRIVPDIAALQTPLPWGCAAGNGRERPGRRPVPSGRSA